MRADALKIVASSAAQALARLQFMRIAFGAAGSAGAELDLGEVGRLVGGLLRRRQRSQLEWQSAHINWPKDWAKLLMNSALAGRGLPAARRQVKVDDQRAIRRRPSFKIRATGPHARVLEEVEKAVRGETSIPALDARGVQPF